MAYTPYTLRGWSNDNPPAINQDNLNAMDNEIAALDKLSHNSEREFSGYIKSFIGYYDDAFTQERYFDQTGAGRAATGGNWRATASIAIPTGATKIFAKLYQNSAICSPIVFYSGPGVFLSNITTLDADAGVGTAVGVIDIPTNAVYVRFCKNINFGEQYAGLMYDDMTQQILDNTEQIEEIKDGISDIGLISTKAEYAVKSYVPVWQDQFTYESYLDPSGAGHSSPGGDWRITSSIKIPAGATKIFAKLYQNSSVCSPIVFYSNPGVILSTITTIDSNVGVGVASGVVNIPTNAVYVRFCLRVSQGQQYAGILFEDLTNEIVDYKNTKNRLLVDCMNKPFTLSGANVIGFGDSIMYGYLDLQNHVSINPWPTLVSSRLGFANFNNKAVGGAGFLVGTNILAQIQPMDISRRDIIFIAAGTNDYEKINVSGSIDYRLALSDFETAVENTFDYIDEHKGTNTKVIVITPINRSKPANQDQLYSLNDYREILTKKALLHEYNVIDGRKLPFMNVANDYQTETLTDGLHPSDLGYRLYANYICGMLV